MNQMLCLGQPRLSPCYLCSSFLVTQKRGPTHVRLLDRVAPAFSVNTVGTGDLGMNGPFVSGGLAGRHAASMTRHFVLDWAPERVQALRASLWGSVPRRQMRHCSSSLRGLLGFSQAAK